MGNVIVPASGKRLIRQMRLSMELSPQLLAAKAGVALGTVKSLENPDDLSGKHQIQLGKICRVLNLTLSAVLRAPLRDAKSPKARSTYATVRRWPCGLFLAAPMAAHGAGYEEENAAILEFVARLTKAKLFENGFYAGMQLKTPADFDDHCEAWGINLPMLKGCEAFVLIYPTPIPTSALIELGIALTRDIPVRVFTKDIEKLPFLLRQPTRALADLIVVKYRDLGQVVDFLSKDAEVLEALGIVSPLNSSRS